MKKPTTTNNPLDFSFDEDDRNLFQVDNIRLRADALRHSVLPRLHVVMNESIAMINRIYDIDVLEDSVVGHSPQFRTKRENELKLLYEWAAVDLVSRSAKGKWVGMERRDGKPVQVLPYRYGFSLTEEGLCIGMTSTWLKGLSAKSYQRLFDFHVEHQALIYLICSVSHIRQRLFWQGLALDPDIRNIEQYYKYSMGIKAFDNNFFSETLPYPISSEAVFGKTYALAFDLSSMVLRYAAFYPIYDSYLQISKNSPVRLEELFDKLREEFGRILDEEDDCPDDSNSAEIQASTEDNENIRQLAQEKIRVMPALRWRVFQRDNWKCVACGRSADDEIILHIDHILPRSKGGGDGLENLQTLCHVCNIGKSNRDSTNLRLKSA